MIFSERRKEILSCKSTFNRSVSHKKALVDGGDNQPANLEPLSWKTMAPFISGATNMSYNAENRLE